MTKKEEKEYFNFCHDLAEIMRNYWKDTQPEKDPNVSYHYPEFRPLLRAHVARKLLKLGYCKVKLRLGNAGLIE